MSKCPKCGANIPIYHLSLNCKNCGINLRFYNFEENFVRDAKESELARAGMNIFVAKLRATTIGGALPIIRLVVMFFPIFAVVAPVSTLFFNLPLEQSEVGVGAMGIYSAFTGGFLNYIMGMTSSQISGKMFLFALIALVCYALAALISFIAGVITLLSCVKWEKSVKRNIIWESVGFLFVIVSIVLSAIIEKSSPAGSLVSCKLSPMLIIPVLSYIAIIVVNVLIGINKPQLICKEGDEERAAIYKKVKSGEINLDDLPFPVIETEETRKIDEKIAAMREEKLKKAEEEANG